MLREREIFLGVKSKARGKGSKDFAQIGGNSLELAWNTAGLLPTAVNPADKKNSIKDFETLKFLNDTILRDEVLDKFMQKAGEIEKAAGPRARRSPSPTKKKLGTPLERMESALRRNPHAMHAATRFESFFQTSNGSGQVKRKQTSKPAADTVRDAEGVENAEEGSADEVRIKSNKPKTKNNARDSPMKNRTRPLGSNLKSA